RDTPVHVGAERGQRRRLSDLRFGDIGAAAATPVEITIPDQVVEGGPQRQAGKAEVGRELALGRDRLPDLERLDKVEHAVARVLLFTHATLASGIALRPSSSA